MGRAENRSDELVLKQLQDLERENAMLKTILDKHGISYSLPVERETIEQPVHIATNHAVRLSLQEKVAVFQSLFQGRDDVFAKRWYSPSSQKAGYQPVCEREWNREYCDKRKYKCGDCPNRLFAYLSYNDFFNHLAGKDLFGRDVIGLYPICKDNTCYFLCTDFDDKNCEHGYKNDVLAFVNVCKNWNVPYYIERSRSGNGAHVWIFFDKPIMALMARKLGNAILTEAMNRDARLSFKSYDRFFPNQDTLPEGGLGNLVALPLQGMARRKGNSVFVDDEFNAYVDQWALLSQIQKLTEAEVDLLLRQHMMPNLGELSKSCETKPWETPQINTTLKDSYPKQIALTRANILYIPLTNLSAKCVNAFKRVAAFRNPEFYEKQNMRLSTYNIPRIISCSEMTDDYLALPRGCEDAVCDILSQHNVNVTISDKTNPGRSIHVTFKGELREEQQKAMEAFAEHNIGTLSATTAFGKTVFALGMIAKRKVNTLILVHNKALLEQWKERLDKFLEINETIEEPEKRRGRKNKSSIIGCLCSGKNSLHGIIDIALIQSCLSEGEVKPFVRDYGMVVVDECHHVSSVSFEQVLRHVIATYVYGLTATPIRKDGRQPIIFMQCGKIRFTSDAKAQIANQTFKRILNPRFTSFHNITSENKSYVQITKALSEDVTRNEFIIEDVKIAIQKGHTPLVLTTRTAHVRILAEMLMPFVDHVVQLIGADSTKEKRLALQKLQTISPTDSLAIVATGKYVGEGFDYPRLDALFLTMPIAWKGNVEQYAGRLHREYEGKSEVVIYDYVDIHIPLCDSMYRKRLKGYASAGYGKNAIMKVADNQPQELIYERNNYENAFRNDLANAKHSVLIAVPKVKFKYRTAMMSTLSVILHNGVDVALRIKEEGAKEMELAKAGIDVLYNKEQTLQCAIIDKSIVWYGSINFFDYNTEASNIMRIVDHKIANEMIDILLTKVPDLAQL